MALTILVLLPPLASLALHLYGRARFASAVSELEALVGEPLVFDLAQLRTTPPPRQHNMAAWLAEGAAAMEPWSKEEIVWQSEARRLPRDAWSPQLEAGVRSMVQRQSEALEILYEAAPLLLSDYGVPHDEVTASHLFPYLLDLLKAAKLLNLEARLAFADGAAERSPAIFRYGDQLTEMVYKAQRIASQRQLVSAAIAMRRIGIAEGSYPWQRPDLAVLDQPDPFAGRPVAYRLRDDGSLLLEIEDGLELSRQLFPRVDHSRETDVFSTILPTPQPMSGTKVSRHRRQEEEPQNKANAGDATGVSPTIMVPVRTVASPSVYRVRREAAEPCTPDGPAQPLSWLSPIKGCRLRGLSSTLVVRAAEFRTLYS